MEPSGKRRARPTERRALLVDGEAVQVMQHDQAAVGLGQSLDGPTKGAPIDCRRERASRQVVGSRSGRTSMVGVAVEVAGPYAMRERDSTPAGIVHNRRRGDPKDKGAKRRRIEPLLTGNLDRATECCRGDLLCCRSFLQPAGDVCVHPWLAGFVEPRERRGIQSGEGCGGPLSGHRVATVGAN